MQLRFGEWLFDTDAHRLCRNDAAVHLTPKAFELLRILIDARPRVVTKTELRELLWPDVIVDEANLKNLIAEIRGVLGAEAARVIRTVHRYGYAFAGGDETVEARLIERDRVHRLHRGENRIGRGSDCAVVIDLTGVSRHHAVIRNIGERWSLEDLDSKNGTWRNEERVTGVVELQDGDRIRIGASSLMFRSIAPADTTTLDQR